MDTLPTTNEDYCDFFRNLLSNLNLKIADLGNNSLPQIVVHLLNPPPESPSSQFCYAVSWMYVVVFESGTSSFKFLVERSRTTGLDPHSKLDQFCAELHALRTLFQHGLDQTDSKDAYTLSLASHWLSLACKAPEVPDQLFWPKDIVDWKNVEMAFKEASHSFFEQVIKVVTEIQTDDSSALIIQEWISRCENRLPNHIFDELTMDAAQKFGLDFLDCVRIRRSNIQTWNQKLRFVDQSANLSDIARILVEESVLNEWENYCPLSANDLINDLGMNPGPQIRETLQEARLLWKQSPCSKEDLLLKIKIRPSTRSL